jgi:hypothetical protein
LLSAGTMQTTSFLVGTAIVLAACGGATASQIGDQGADPPDGGTTSRDAATRTSEASDFDNYPDGSKGTPRVPAVHRPAPVACSHQRGAGNANPDLTFGACKTDVDCATGTNGRCNHSTFGAQVNNCSYDTCFADTDCGPNTVCTCREDASSTNRCAAVGNCKVDADCGNGNYCSPSVPFDKINLGVAGFYCHTGADTCVDDADCRQENAPAAACAFEPATSRWACSTTGFFPP